jgi:hypothetical protein
MDIEKKKLIIDACFWINIIFIGLEKELLKYFKLYFVSKVDKEILYNENLIYVSRDYDIYLKLKEKKIISIQTPKILPPRLSCLEKGSGEINSIALSIEKNIFFATDDNGPIEFCKSNNVKYINSIYFILFLFNKKEITPITANKCIALLRNRIKEKYIIEGKKYLKEKGDGYEI